MAAKRFGTRIDLQNNEILNMIFQKSNGLPTPTSTLNGAARFNTADGRFYVCNGTAWNLRATDADALQGFSPAQLRDRGSHTGSQDVSTISGFDAGVNARRVTDLTGTPNKALQMGNQQIKGVASGTDNSDAVSLAQLQAVRDLATSAAGGIAIKDPVLVVAPTNVDLSVAAPTAIDGVTLTGLTNPRILLANQTDSSQNGIYTRPSSGPLVRSGDADAGAKLVPGTQVFVTRGDANADSQWVIISDAVITIGSTPQGWTRMPGSQGVSYAFGNGLNVSGQNVTVKPGFGISVVDGSTAVDRASVPIKNVQAIPAGTSPVVVNHGLGTADILAAQVRDLATGDLVTIGITVVGVNTVSLDFAVNPSANQYRLAICG